MYVQVNLGRGFQPQGFARCELSFQQWTRFQLDVETAIVNFADAMRGAGDSVKGIETHNGLGAYNDQIETSAHISIFFDDHTRIDSYVEELVADFELDLKGIAGQYWQESVALIIAGSYTNKADRATLIYS